MLKLYNFDSNACFGVPEPVAASLGPIGSQPANASAVHQAGQTAKAKIEEARENVLSLLGLSASEFGVSFCSGATEANNWILRAVLGGEGKGEAVVSAVEHPSVLEAAHWLTDQGVTVHLAPVDQSGRLDLESFAHLLSANTRLVSVMAINNETGVLQPLTEALRLVRSIAPRAVFHSDAVQLPGKLLAHPYLSELDALTLSAHKFGGLTGIGALVARKKLSLSPLLYGGPQEQHSRAGTENTLGIHSMGEAARWMLRHQDEVLSAYGSAKQALLDELGRREIDFRLNVPTEWSAANTLSLCFPGLNGDDLVVALDLAGVLVSSGAACASGKPTASHVLLAQGVSEADAKSSLRVSFSGVHSKEELLEGVQVLADTIERFSA